MKLSARAQLISLLALVLLPPLAVFGIGVFWFWERGFIFWFIGVFVIWEVLILFLLKHSEILKLPQPKNGKPLLPWASAPRDEEAQKIFETYKNEALEKNYELNLFTFIEVAQELAHRISKYYFPDSKNSALEVSVPRLSQAMFRASADLYDKLRNVPVLDKVTIHWILEREKDGVLLRRLGRLFFLLYRIARAIAHSPTALGREFVEQRFLAPLSENIATSFKKVILSKYLNALAPHMIRLYSAVEPLKPSDDIIKKFYPDLIHAKNIEKIVDAEPVRIVIIGQSKSGKSSLINCLFDEVRAATDIIPTTTKVTPYVLTLGNETLILYDTGGYEQVDDPVVLMKNVMDQALKSDLLILLCKATDAARKPDANLLKGLHDYYAQKPGLRPPLKLVILSHVDLLSPPRDWNPPYDFVTPSSEKEKNILAAMKATLRDLKISPTCIIPVCLKEDRHYNIEQVRAAIFENLPDAKKRKLLRILRAQKEDEAKYKFYWEQLKSFMKMISK